MLGQVSRIVLPLPLCVLLFGTSCCITAIYSVTESVQSPVWGKCLTFDRCCIVLAPACHPLVPLLPAHLVLCRALVKPEWNQGTSGAMWETDRAGPAPCRAGPALLWGPHGHGGWTCPVPHLSWLAVLQNRSIVLSQEIWAEQRPLCCFPLCQRRPRLDCLVALLTEMQLWAVWNWEHPCRWGKSPDGDQQSWVSAEMGKARMLQRPWNRAAVSGKGECLV